MPGPAFGGIALDHKEADGHSRFLRRRLSARRHSAICRADGRCHNRARRRIAGKITGMADYDLAIIGGGINGAGIARDAAGRGLRVLLLEQNDLGSGTSSASTKLIHGGLRYLEHGAFAAGARGADRARGAAADGAACRSGRCASCCRRSRGRARRHAADRAVPLRLARRAQNPAGRAASTSPITSTGQPLLRKFRYGFEYSDCWADDSRLVVLNALDAAERGADHPHPHARHPRRARGRLEADPQRAGPPRGGDRARAGQRRRSLGRHRLRDRAAHGRAGRRCGSPRAATSWCASCSTTTAATSSRTPTSASCSRCRSRDDFTLIGTTDENFAGALDAVAPSADEVIYLCRAVNEFFRDRVEPEQVVWAFAGVRSLYDDERRQGRARGRHARLSSRARRAATATAPVLTVYGGKITTYRRLAEDALGKLAHFFQLHRRGPRRRRCRAAIFSGTRSRRGWRRPCGPGRSSTRREAWRLVRAYGTRVERVLGDAKKREDIGPCFGRSARPRCAT